MQNVNKHRAGRDKHYTMSRGGIRMGGGDDNAFNSVQLERPDSSYFDLSSSHTLTGNHGKIIPINTIECYPGDRMKLSNEILLRYQPMIAPAMQRSDAFIHHFFVPHRIVWEDFENFLKGEAVTLPYITFNSGDFQAGLGIVSGLGTGVHEYLGVPPLTSPRTMRVNALPFAGIQRVFFEYYRDQNLSSMTDNDKPFALSGDNTGAQKTMLLTLRKRAYNHDYFTSALPFTQKGTEAVIAFDFDDVPVRFQQSDFPTDFALAWDVTGDTSGVNPLGGVVTAGVPTNEATIETLFFAKTSEITGAGFSINDFRLAMATQAWLERMAVGGTRYTEIIKAHFGVSSSDMRLDRPEYIGGMRTPVVISEVLQTSETNETPQGNMSGHGLAASFSDDDEEYYCEEHGYIISLLSVMPLARYTTGLRRDLDWTSRNERDEWYWPAFANLGEQAIKKREIYADTDAGDEDWGYTARFNELRYQPSKISGNIKTDLSPYTAARIFSGLPSLNEAFLTNVLDDVKKMFTVEPTDDIHELIIDVLNKVDAIRLLPKYATPAKLG